MPLSYADDNLEKVKHYFNNSETTYDDSNTAIVILETLIPSSKEQETIINVFIGSFHTRKARESWLPWKKINLCIKGLAMIDKAIAEDEENLEARFIRLQVNWELPTFFNRSAMIREDISFIVDSQTKQLSDRSRYIHMLLSIANFYRSTNSQAELARVNTMINAAKTNSQQPIDISKLRKAVGNSRKNSAYKINVSKKVKIWFTSKFEKIRGYLKDI